MFWDQILGIDRRRFYRKGLYSSYPQNDTLSVMPIIKQNPLNTICARRSVPFSYVVEIPKVDQRAAKDKVLVHVRKLDGNAVNTLLEE